MQGAGVQIDAVRGVFDDLFRKQMGQPRGERAFRRTGKAAIQIAAIGQITGVVYEPMHIHHRHRQQHPAQPFQGGQLEDAADDFHAVDLIAVNRRRNEQPRPRHFTVDHMHRHGDFAVGVKPGDVQINRQTRARRHRGFIDDEGFALHRDSISLYRGYGFYWAWRFLQ